MSKSRQLVAIMFTDIVGYTSLMGNNERKAFEILSQNRQIQKPIIEQFNGRWIKELGDGVMASFNSVSDAVHAAIKIQQSCTTAGTFQLRIGIHLGEVVFENEDLFGDGVNIASRIQALAPAGSIWISESVYNNVVNKDEIVTEFVKVEHLKNVKEPIRIYQVHPEGVELIKPVKPSKEKNKPDSSRPKSKVRIIISLAIVALVSIALVIYFQAPKQTNNEAEGALDKSIAVLPFVDLSEQKDQGWFGDGLTEEILNSLTKVKGLKVTSRTSSFAFKNKNLRIQTIADSLGVNYVVEGSVRKVNDGLRITAQLIRAKDDFHIWSNTYDRNSKDIFVLQQEIATKIAESLDISLDPFAIKEMQSAGTTNPEAFLAFLKGRELDDNAHEDGRFIKLKELKKANVFYEESSKLDPEFVNPYLYHADFFLHYVLADDPDYTDTLTEKQAYKMFMDDLGNTVMRSREAAKRDYYRLPQIMYSNDWSNFREAIEKSLNSPDAVKYFRYQNFDISSLLICLGYGDQLIDLSRKMMENDPSDQSPIHQIISTHIFYGKYQDALNEIAKVGVNPDQPQRYFIKLFCMLQLGQVDEAYNLIVNQELEYFSHYDIKALILAKKGLKEEAKSLFEIAHRTGPLSLIVVNELYGRQEANRRANLSDQKMLLDFQLFRSYLFAPKNLPFDLSATPNFARKLKQAGVDLTQN